MRHNLNINIVKIFKCKNDDYDLTLSNTVRTDHTASSTHASRVRPARLPPSVTWPHRLHSNRPAGECTGALWAHLISEQRRILVRET